MTGRLPDAIVVGAPKTGTTTLCAALARVDGIWMYPRKETHFFNDHYARRGIDWYRDLFRDAPEDALVMEGTPDYAMAPGIDETFARMARHVPRARLVYMLREPVARVESHLVQMMANHRRAMPLAEALARWPEVVDTSDYPAVLAAIHRHYPAGQVHVLTLEDYRADPRACHARVLRFLGRTGDLSPALDAMEGQAVLHTRAGQGIDRPLLAWLRRLPNYDRLNALMPGPVIRLGKRALRRPLRVEGSLPDAARARLDARLRPGWERLCETARVGAV
ncbi:sulfotransferase domain-containing protein [Jannaschia sp. W003]|uniref:sulfotransferase domain-containing protein n=1 Tax=Jannaschia sp. W003 TaxID=2867012 RepID=UPI0021A50FD3|nr:sulfotransferase domain-containing protein [Jannaschia sp. W003]UWQ21553.1 sulfotransferase domain-containing protein [Jannaschia sp. W003]